MSATCCLWEVFVSGLEFTAILPAHIPECLDDWVGSILGVEVGVTGYFVSADDNLCNNSLGRTALSSP